jgi:photosystem II stability/assembly factor-like uncharacterized protein
MGGGHELEIFGLVLWCLRGLAIVFWRSIRLVRPTLDAAANHALGLRTDDGGLNWNAQYTGRGYRLFAVSLVDGDTGTAVGDLGGILHTGDGGMTWTVQASRTLLPLHGVSFVDANTGTAVGVGGIILRTNTGGE